MKNTATPAETYNLITSVNIWAEGLRENADRLSEFAKRILAAREILYGVRNDHPDNSVRELANKLLNILPYPREGDVAD